MHDVRCQCGKIVSQTDEGTVLIKCRHCKRYVVIHTSGVGDTEFRNAPEPEPRQAREAHRGEGTPAPGGGALPRSRVRSDEVR